MFKKFTAIVICSAVLIANPALSATFGKSSSSSTSSKPSSSTSSYKSSPSNSGSSYTAPTSNSTTAQSGSLSKGQAVGMTRTDVTQSVKDGSYKQNNTVTPTAPVNNNNANQGSAYPNSNYSNAGQVPQSSGYGMGTVLGAAAGGAMLGYMLHRDNNGNSYYTNPNNPNVAYDSNGHVLSSFPSGIAPSSAPSGGLGFFFWLIILMLIGAVIYYFMRKNRLAPANNYASNAFSTTPVFASISSPRTQLEDEAEKMFINFQKNNRPSQLSAIEAQSESVFFAAIKDSVMSASDTKEVTIKSIEAEVVDVSPKGSRLVGSVRYRAVIQEINGNTLTKTTLDEVWHYIHNNSLWLLAGIEPVSDEQVETQQVQGTQGTSDPKSGKGYKF